MSYPQQPHYLRSPLDGICCSLLRSMKTYPSSQILPLLMILSWWFPLWESSILDPSMRICLGPCWWWSCWLRRSSQATSLPHSGLKSVLILHENSWGQEDRDYTRKWSPKESWRQYHQSEPSEKRKRFHQVTPLVCRIYCKF